MTHTEVRSAHFFSGSELTAIESAVKLREDCVLQFRCRRYATTVCVVLESAYAHHHPAVRKCESPQSGRCRIDGSAGAGLEASAVMYQTATRETHELVGLSVQYGTGVAHVICGSG